jgi:two-component system, sensor histidine kinase and response regulator
MFVTGHSIATYFTNKKFNGRLKQVRNRLWLNTVELSEDISSLGITRKMEEYEKRKLRIFNQLVFFQAIAACVFPVPLLFEGWRFSFISQAVVLPVAVSVIVLLLNLHRRYNTAMICYFMAYPVITSITYMRGVDLGIELNFILYGILAVFFLKDMGIMLFSITLSMISYFVLTVLIKNYSLELSGINFGFYLFNQLLAVGFIFYGLYLIKRENAGHQMRILAKTRVLHKKSLEILHQKREIQQKAALLEKQTRELQELNHVKDKLFSVIAHDLKTPMYALRNLFYYIEERDMPPDEIKLMIPDVMHDLNYTTELMENLLLWAKSQMQTDTLKPNLLQVSEITENVLRLLRLQASTKNIDVCNNCEEGVYAVGDKDMISLVLRNLLSNAIKFTPPGGTVEIGSQEINGQIELFVKDTGTGMSPETLEKINQNEYYSTRGTSNESGTGLGLMLCREFVNRNGGVLKIESRLGKGSIFTFSLPKADISDMSEEEMGMGTGMMREP